MKASENKGLVLILFIALVAYTVAVAGLSFALHPEGISPLSEFIFLFTHIPLLPVSEPLIGIPVIVAFLVVLTLWANDPRNHPKD